MKGVDGARNRVKVIYRQTSELRPDPKNPRLHAPRQIGQIARSIQAFGFNVPVLIDANLNVIAGHGRVLACRELGIKEVPTIQLEHLSEPQARAFRIADNRLTEISVWDEELLAEQLKELSLLDLDFTLDVVGFEMAEIDLKIESLSENSDRAEAADVLPDVHAGPSVSRTGDRWILGKHRVYCGSAVDEASYPPLMQGEKAAMAFIDPPYNVRIEGNVSGLGAVRHPDFIMASGEMDEAQFTTFLTRACSLLGAHSVDGSLHSIFMDWRHQTELLAAGREVYTELKNLCVWVKNNGGMGSFYRSRHEFVFVFKHGRAPHQNNIQLGQFGRNRTNVWEYPCISAFGRSGEEGNLLAIHPSVKSAALVSDAILDASRRGEIVLDTFLGSGTTVIAAERTGRRCYGLELDPIYVDTIVRRWQNFTGEKARHATTGQLFNDAQPAAEGKHGN
jgi:DNA modification methylase